MFGVLFYSESVGEVSYYLGEVTTPNKDTVISYGRRYSRKYVELFDTELEAIDFLAEL